jgi:hypothetical protein
MTRSITTEPMDWERPSERFLAYLDRLAAACITRDRGELEKLMRMRMSSHVPRAVVDAPLKLMRYVHKMRQLSAAAPDGSQLPLQLREREVAPPPAPKPQVSRRARRSTS